MSEAIVWTISSIDSTGLVGIHLDLETLKNFSINAYSITTAVTTQEAHTINVIKLFSSDQVAAQCTTLQLTSKPRAIKIGMLGTFSILEKIANFLITYSGTVVLDPLMPSNSNTILYATNLVKLFPYVDIITLNRIQVEKILNCSLHSYQAIRMAARALIRLGAKSVLLTGGHVSDILFNQDYWTNGHESFWISQQRSPEKNYHGLGCVLSSAIAACLARGHSIKDAIVIAKMYVNRGIRRAMIDRHSVKFFHGGWPKDPEDLPYLLPQPLLKLPLPFQRCQIGLYPVVDSSHWLEKLLPHGVKCIQLRIKNAHQATLEKEIKRSIFLAKKYAATLFINDYWHLAIHFGAHGVHLGQEDLHEADIDHIYDSGLYLGVSTHCYYEVARAHALNPSYIACGPVYATQSKIMSFPPQGIKQLQCWRQTLRHYLLVAIGGITLKHLPDVLRTGMDGISLISAITQASNPLSITQQFLTQINESNDG